MIQNAKKNSFFFIGKTEVAEGKKMNLTGMASSGKISKRACFPPHENLEKEEIVLQFLVWFTSN